MNKCIAAIHIFIIIKLGGANIKKKKSSKPYMASDKSELSERSYKQMLESDERALWAIYNSLALCVPFCFYPYTYPMFPQIELFDNEMESSEVEKHLKNKMNK
ncbi:MAG: hypothetical protein QM683_05630 [Lacrimispora sp.]